MGYRKRMGQHFLRDPRVADRQVALADVKEGDVVLEIGGGRGFLTERLAAAAERVGARVVVIEKDPGLAGMLKDRYGYHSGYGSVVEVIEGDALEIGWPSFSLLVANIPYVISSPLTMKVVEAGQRKGGGFRRAVVMYQLEFARRLAAPPGTREVSRLGIKVQSTHSVRLAFRVPRGAFSPPPKVDSAVVVIEPLENPPIIEDREVFSTLADLLFSRRRKKVANILRPGAIPWPLGEEGWMRLREVLGTPRERTWRTTTDADEKPMGEKRPERLTMEEMVYLANTITSFLKNGG
ncbi:MAG: ribosomal RNA small subunit methyltransferase A [Thermoplasmata archaeon]|nr:ribosomal RNA small subunit methyltransferase A [Thermoplasmata archaeon]